MPQGFTKLGSVIFAIPAMSETRLVCVNVGVIDAEDAYRNMATAAEAIHKTKSIRATPNELPFFTRTLLGFGVNLIRWAVFQVASGRATRPCNTHAVAEAVAESD